MSNRKIITTPINLLAIKVFVLFAVYIQNTCALDLYTIVTSNSSTSDDIELNTVQLSYINNQREHFWPYVNSADSKWDWGFDIYSYDGQANSTDFTGHHLQGLIGWNYSTNTYLSGRVGIHQLNVPEQKNKKDKTTCDLHGQLGLTSNFTLFMNIAEDYVYQFGLQPAGAREFLTAEKRETGLNWRPTEKIRISGSSSKWELSDSNIRRENKAAILYGLSLGWPWIWIGLSYEKLKFDIAKSNYWTPMNFRSAGLVIETSFPISGNLSGAVSGSLTKYKEDNYPEGDGNSINVGFDYKITKMHTLRIVFNRIESLQKSSGWTEDTFSMSVNGTF